MADVMNSRKQRLRTLENIIRDGMEKFVATGFALKEIRDDELYKEDDFETWDAYLRKRVEIDFGVKQTQVRELLVCAQVRIKLPDLPKVFTGIPVKNGEEGKPEWSQSAVYQFARLAPRSGEGSGQPFDLDRLKQRDVERVAKKVFQHCEKEEVKPTATIV